MKKLLMIIILLLLTHNTLAVGENGKVKVYVADMRPCVIIEGSEDSHTPARISGFEIELWNEIGKELAARDVIVVWELVPVKWDELEPAIRNGEADVACAGLTQRSYRMDWADFSIPTVNSGLGIMTLKEEIGILGGCKILFESLKKPVTFFVSFVLIFALFLWWSERDDDPTNDTNGISDKFIPGIFEAIYFCVVTCSTVGYGDFAPKKWKTRAITLVLIIVGLGAFANFLSLLSVARIETVTGGIQSPEDLKGKVVLTQKGTTSVDYARGLGVSKVKGVNDIDMACDHLLLERGDAVVYDHPVLLNYVKENPDKVQLANDVFDKQYYGYVFQKGSELKREVDIALLEIHENGTYERLYKKWF
jgi:polar amino acid transport system substrate-binding protein